MKVPVYDEPSDQKVTATNKQAMKDVPAPEHGTTAVPVHTEPSERTWDFPAAGVVPASNTLINMRSKKYPQAAKNDKNYKNDKNDFSLTTGWQFGPTN